MPHAKKSAKKTAGRKIPQAALSKAYEAELSYETRIIITVLLLLFIYPIGLIFMWAWMRNWPLWLKLLITLPLIFGIFAFFSFMVLIGSVLTHVRIEQGVQERIQQMQLTQTPAPSLPVTMTPTTTQAQTTPVTY